MPRIENIMEHIVPYCKIKIALDGPWNVFSQYNQFFTVVSCQPGSPASQRVDAKGLVCTLVRHVFFAENFQVRHFLQVQSILVTFPCSGCYFYSRNLSKGWGFGVQNTSGQGEPTSLGCGLPDTSSLLVIEEVLGHSVEFPSSINELGLPAPALCYQSHYNDVLEQFPK